MTCCPTGWFLGSVKMCWFDCTGRICYYPDCWWNFFLQADKCNTWNSPREIWVLPNNLQVEDIRTWWNRCFALQHEPWLTCMAIHGKSQKNNDISMKPKLILGKKLGGYVHNQDMRKDYIAACVWMASMWLSGHDQHCTFGTRCQLEAQTTNQQAALLASCRSGT